MRKFCTAVIILSVAMTLCGCGKSGVMGGVTRAMGNWVQINLPEGCKVKQLAADDHSVAVLCEDGRVFH